MRENPADGPEKGLFSVQAGGGGDTNHSRCREAETDCAAVLLARVTAADLKRRAALLAPRMLPA
jgi:hypothetical protein